jgi:hypothetical protein
VHGIEGGHVAASGLPLIAGLGVAERIGRLAELVDKKRRNDSS